MGKILSSITGISQIQNTSNTHILHICTVELQNKNVLSWKLKELSEQMVYSISNILLRNYNKSSTAGIFLMFYQKLKLKYM